MIEVRGLRLDGVRCIFIGKLPLDPRPEPDLRRSVGKFPPGSGEFVVAAYWVERHLWDVIVRFRAEA